MAWSLKSCHLQKSRIPSPKVQAKISDVDTHSKVFLGFLLTNKQKKGIVILGKAS